jgi:hypothetical protein
VYIGAALASQNLRPFLRMTVKMTVDDVNGDAPVLHRWEMTYLCQNAL